MGDSLKMNDEENLLKTIPKILPCVSTSPLSPKQNFETLTKSEKGSESHIDIDRLKTELDNDKMSNFN